MSRKRKLQAPPPPPPVSYRPEDFTIVPEELRDDWQAVVERDLKRSSAQAITYREWRMFARLAFQPWHVRSHITSEFDTDPTKPLAESVVEEAILHCCGTLSNAMLRDKIAVHLLRRKDTVATLPIDKKRVFFRNDIELALYMLYEPEASRSIENYCKSHHVETSDEDRIRFAVLGALRSHATMRYIQEKEDKWTGHMRWSLRRKLGSAQAAAIHKRRGRDGRPSLHRLMFGEAEIKVLRAYCENLLSGNEKTNSELARDMAMTPENFGAALGNAMKKIRTDPFLRRDFNCALSENEDGHRR